MKAELVFKSNMNIIQQNCNPIPLLIIKACSQLQINALFPSLNEHILNQSPIHNHLLQLIKNISISIDYNVDLHYAPWLNLAELFFILVDLVQNSIISSVVYLVLETIYRPI